MSTIRMNIIKLGFVFAAVILASVVLTALPYPGVPAAYADQSNKLTVAAEQFGTGESAESARELSVGMDGKLVTTTSSLNSDSNSRWYKFKVADNVSVYSFGFTAYKINDEGAIAYSGEKIKVDLLDSNMKVVRSGTGYDVHFYLSNVLKENAYYYLNIELVATDGEYHETEYDIVSRAMNVLEKVTFKGAIASKKNSATVKWNKQASATKYQVRYKTPKGKYATKTTTKNSINLTKLKKGTKYYVNVRAYCKGAYDTTGYYQSDWGEWSATKTFKTKG